MNNNLKRRIRSKRKLQNTWEAAFQSKSFAAVETKENDVIENTDEMDRSFDITTEPKEKECNWEVWSDTEDECNMDNGITEENDPNTTTREHSLMFIASVFVQNNVSRHLGKDFFTCFELLKLHSNIKLNDVKKVMEEWASCSCRVYSFCVCCSSILPQSRKCTNKACNRYSVSQSNLSSMKTVITFSLRQQVEELIKSGCFGSNLITRTTENSILCGRLCETRKYKEKLLKCEEEHPDMITLLLSMNTDGFRKRGSSRGEMWPTFLALHDISKGSGTFREYNPQHVVLSAIMKSNQKLQSSDFEALFERMNHELEETTQRPLSIQLFGKIYKVRLELYQSVLDMDASRKIRGLPVWQSYGCCSLCDVKGNTVKTKGGSTISWYSEFGSNEYDDDSPRPTKLLPTCLPLPWHDGFDGLHIIHEGTTKDLLKDLLGNGKRTGFPIRKKFRTRWSIALNSANIPRGRSSAALIHPIQLSTRSGSELQELYDLAVPILILLYPNTTDWTAMIYLHWILTRNVINCHLTLEKSEEIGEMSAHFRKIVGSSFPLMYSMKFHVFVDHLVPKLHLNGNPMLSSAAPFERMNQTLGRSSNSFTTRTLANISNRFLAYKKSVQYICNLSKQTGIQFPETMRASGHDLSMTSCKEELDKEPLEDEECELLARFRLMDFNEITFITSFQNDRDTFSVRKSCLKRTVHNCYIYFRDKKNRIRFGSLERVFIHESRKFAIVQQFKTTDPFEKNSRYLARKFQYSRISFLCDKLNDFFLQVIGSSLTIIDVRYFEGFATVVEFSNNSYVSRC